MIKAKRDTHHNIRKQNDEYVHRPNDSYNIVKYGTYQANRIFFSFDDEARVEETYNERIFNCYYKYKGKEQLLQLRNANEICDHIINKDKESFIELFKDNYYKLHKEALLNGLIQNNNILKDRVKIEKSGDYIVDDVFKVDSHANTYVMERHRIKDSKRLIRWQNLCTTIPNKNKERTIHTKEIGDVEVDEATLRCLGKIFGLVQPHTWDSVVWGQIPKWLKKIYKDELEAYNERIKA
jgi:hypothetical protein